MTPLRKILEETFGQIEWQGSGGSNEPVVTHKVILNQGQLDLVHQQILALIPKKKTYFKRDFMSNLKRYSEAKLREEGFNQAISDMEQSMTGEK